MTLSRWKEWCVVCLCGKKIKEQKIRERTMWTVRKQITDILMRQLKSGLGILALCIVKAHNTTHLFGSKGKIIQEVRKKGAMFWRSKLP